MRWARLIAQIFQHGHRAVCGGSLFEVVVDVEEHDFVADLGAAAGGGGPILVLFQHQEYGNVSGPGPVLSAPRRQDSCVSGRVSRKCKCMRA